MTQDTSNQHFDGESKHNRDYTDLIVEQEAVQAEVIYHQKSTLDAIRRVVESGEVKSQRLRPHIQGIFDIHDEEIQRDVPDLNYERKGAEEMLSQYFQHEGQIEDPDPSEPSIVGFELGDDEEISILDDREASKQELDNCLERIQRSGTEDQPELYRDFVQIANIAPPEELEVDHLKALVRASRIEDEELQEIILETLSNLNARTIVSNEDRRKGPDNWGEFREKVDGFFEEMNPFLETIDNDTENYKRDLFMVFLESQATAMQQ